MKTNKPGSLYAAASLVIIAAICGIVGYFQSSFITIDGDLTYHLSTAQSFVRDGGLTLRETWDSLPLGRPHLYPPVVHFLLAIPLSLGVGPLAAIKIFNILGIAAGLLLGWTGIRRLFSDKAAFAYVALASGFMTYIKLIGITVPASLVILSSPFLVLLIRRRSYLSAAVLMALMFYTHMVFPWLVASALLVWGFQRREYLRPAFRVILGAVILYLPWLIHIASNLEYLRYFHQSYVSIIPQTVTYSGNISILVLFLVSVALLARMARSKRADSDIVYFLALAVVSLPVAYFEFSRYIYSVGAWSMLVVIAYVWSVRGEEEDQFVRNAFSILFACTALVSVSIFIKGDAAGTSLRNNIALEAFAPRLDAYFGRFAPAHFNWYNTVIADIISEKTGPDAVIFSAAHRLDAEEYLEHRMYVLPQLFTALTGLRMANLRSPEYHWQEWSDPLRADIFMVNDDQVDGSGYFMPSSQMQSHGVRPFEVKAHFDLIARTRNGFEVYARKQPSHTPFLREPVAIPLWLGWGILGVAIMSVVASAWHRNELE